MFITLNMAAGQRVEFREAFDFIRVMDAASTINVEFFRDGREVDEANGVGVGYSEKFAKSCDMVAITNGATAQAVSFATRLGSAVAYDRPPTGAVSVTDVAQCPDIAEGTISVGTASTILGGWSPRRRSVLIQNQSDTATIWVSFNNGLATVGNGFRIRPGETFYNDLVSCPKVVNAVSDQAATPVRWVEWQR